MFSDIFFNVSNVPNNSMLRKKDFLKLLTAWTPKYKNVMYKFNFKNWTIDVRVIRKKIIINIRYPD